MGIYDVCQKMELEEKDGAVTEHISIFEGMLTDYRHIDTYKYIVQTGDRIDRIARVLLGSVIYWKYIMLVNPKYLDPTDIKAGDIIFIPKIENVEG